MPRLTGGGSLTSSSKSLQTSRGNKPLKVVSVNLLNDDEELQINVEGKAKVQDLFDEVCQSLGVKETQFFGLAVFKHAEYEFLDPKCKLSKHAPKGWKSDSSNGLDKSGKPLLSVYFKVQLYVEHVSLLKEDLTRHHYYYQLKNNVLSAPVLCREEACFVLASYALQADMGNFSEENHTGHYFKPSSYFPPWVIKRRGEDYFVKHVPAMHLDQKGTSRVYAQKAFIREASNTAEHAMHFYRLKKTKTEQSPSIWLGICTKGIQLYEDSGEGKYPLCEYSWGIIKRLVFQKKKFELQVEGAEGRKITYYTSSEAKSKHLLRLCKMTHAFQMQTQTLVDRAKKRESAADKKKYRESYISGDVSWSDLDSSMTTTSFSEVSNMMELQRRSVVSNVSSVTTSGIVSDERPPLEKNLSEVEFDIDDQHMSGYTLESTLTHNTALPKSLSQLEARHSRQSSGKDEKAKIASWLPGASVGVTPAANNRHSMALSDASSSRDPAGGWGNPAVICSDSEWASDDEAEDDDEEDERDRKRKNVKTKHGAKVDASSTDSQQLGSNQPPAKTLIDPLKSIQAEIASKDVCTPLLSALCNDRSLLMMQQYEHNTTQDNNGNEDDTDRCHSPSDLESGHDCQTASQTDLNISLTTLVSHSSFDSDMHGSICERLHATTSSLVISENDGRYLSGHLSKHQTLSMLNNLPDAETARLPYNGHYNGGSDGRIKCQTLPSKINASEQMLLMGRAASPAAIKEEYVSYSAPNLSPDTEIQVPIPGC
ncbi:uncharacterized protein [Amphiura filiformis]|uniref:uncharacterized protein n=1 Tax=Amphiura filiformis TaxID=82378 RepID=UPI003B20E44B